MSRVPPSPPGLHARWRWRACVQVLLLALPWIVVAIAFARREPAPPVRWLLAASTIVATLAWLARTWRARGIDWFARQLDRHPGLEDSAGLLLGLEAPASPLAALQRQRVQSQWKSIDVQAPRHRLAPLVWNLLAALACVLALVAWQRPLPEPVRARLPAPLAQVLGAQSPSLRSIRLGIEPPAYTGLPSRIVDAAEARVPEASTLGWSLRFSVAPTKAWLQIQDGPRIALQERDGAWQASHRVDRPLLYRIVTEPALPAAQRRLHRIDVTRDQPPQVRAITPAQSLNLRTRGQQAWPLLFEAGDDHGVDQRAELRIVQTSGEGENIQASERRLTLVGRGTSKARRFAYTFDLMRSGLTVGNDVIVQLTVRDNRQPRPQVVRSASVILRWPPEQAELATGLDGLMQQVLPAYFRSQRQIIIDAEQLIRDAPKIAADAFVKRSNAIGVDQHTLRLRYGQFLGEESEGNAPLPTSDVDESANAGAAAAHDDGHGGEVPHDQDAPGESAVDAMLAQVSHVHDLPEAATLLDPKTQDILRAALREMWDSETQLRLGKPRDALPFAYKALGLIKRVQQADRIYLPRLGSERPPIDFTRRLGGKRDDLAPRSNAFVAIPGEARPLDTLWMALATDRDGAPVPDAILDAAARWLQARTGDGHGNGDTLAAIAALDALRQQPDCSACREELRGRVWPLLAAPLAKPVPRPQATRSGNAYLDALRREARP